LYEGEIILVIESRKRGVGRGQIIDGRVWVCFYQKDVLVYGCKHGLRGKRKV